MLSLNNKGHRCPYTVNELACYVVCGHPASQSRLRLPMKCLKSFAITLQELESPDPLSRVCATKDRLPVVGAVGGHFLAEFKEVTPILAHDGPKLKNAQTRTKNR